MTKDKHTSQPPEVADSEADTAENQPKPNLSSRFQDADTLRATIRRLRKSMLKED